MDNRTWTQRLLTNILKQGPMPKHVAVIMDGNRRFARKMNYSNVIEGHKKGDETLQLLIVMMKDLDIPELSAYAFSLENFKRSKDEVDGLMALFEERARKMEADLPKLMEHDICVEIVGDYTLAATKELRRMFAKIMVATRHNKTRKINLCFAYTSRAQIAKGMTFLLNGVRSKELNLEDINEELVENTFTLGKYRPVDILVRTSGETRLSDFMLWESGNAYVEILDKDWPELESGDVLRTILNYQLNLMFHGLPQSNDTRGDKKSYASKMQKSRVETFLTNLKTKQWDVIQADAC